MFKVVSDSVVDLSLQGTPGTKGEPGVKGLPVRKWLVVVHMETHGLDMRVLLWVKRLNKRFKDSFVEHYIFPLCLSNPFFVVDFFLILQEQSKCKISLIFCPLSNEINLFCTVKFKSNHGILLKLWLWSCLQPPCLRLWLATNWRSSLFLSSPYFSVCFTSLFLFEYKSYSCWSVWFCVWNPLVLMCFCFCWSLGCALDCCPSWP